ncbi:hypothetical protein [Streptomyces sp. NPDC056061]|uniref:hypothetical protein n=1 Tax=Streptomyces sp. NPDC056061 TaxID=3345700 RepID=UPI0035DF3B51
MATVRKREWKDGTITYQVRWVQGGRDGSNESGTATTVQGILAELAARIATLETP